jgi:predicted TIM-barrel fold metal-dependent hydrolase
MSAPPTDARPEHNVTGHDYAQRRHFRYAGPPIVDFHCHVMRTRPTDPPGGPPVMHGPGATTDQAALMLEVADEFHVGELLTMCPPDDVAPLRERFGDRLLVNASIMKKPDEPDDAAYWLLDRFLDLGAVAVKFWAAPRGRERGLTVDAPWRVESLKRARAAGVRPVMVHVGDPDTWFRTVYADAAKFGTKADQYAPFVRMLEEFPDMTWVGAHMGGDPEHPDHLEEMLERFPHLNFDTSATKWQVREVSARGEAVRSLVERHPGRFLFGSDLVTRHALVREHYVSRYWCQRTLWESDWRGPSPIADPDHTAGEGEGPTPLLAGVGLSAGTLRAVYRDNAARLLGL